jgi:hypothetical protein
VSKSLDKLAAALVDLGHRISPNTVSKLLTGVNGRGTFRECGLPIFPSLAG